MTIDDDIILPILTAIVAIVITISTFFITVEQNEYESTILSQKIDSLYDQLEITERELNYYKRTNASITNLGASEDQSIDIIYAAHKYDLDPKALAALIYSESSFKNRVHSEEGVIGLCGINTKANSDLPHNPHTDAGNILCSAYLLRQYLDTYGTYSKAFKRYKGYCQLGAEQSAKVQQIRKDML